MSKSGIALARAAENRAALDAEARGWIVLGRNVRVGRDELDLVALDGTVLVIVEVRARSNVRDGHPLESVSRAKADRLRRAAIRYAAEHGALEIRIDVVSVVDDELSWIENAVDFTQT